MTSDIKGKTVVERVQEVSDHLYNADFLGRRYLADYVADVGTLCFDLKAAEERALNAEAEVEGLVAERASQDIAIDMLKADLEKVTAERDAMRAAFEKATWMLDGAAENIDEWFPNDEHPDVQGDLRKCAAMWREEFGFRYWRAALDTENAQ